MNVTGHGQGKKILQMWPYLKWKIKIRVGKSENNFILNLTPRFLSAGMSKFSQVGVSAALSGRGAPFAYEYENMLNFGWP